MTVQSRNYNIRIRFFEQGEGKIFEIFERAGKLIFCSDLQGWRVRKKFLYPVQRIAVEVDSGAVYQCQHLASGGLEQRRAFQDRLGRQNR